MQNYVPYTFKRIALILGIAFSPVTMANNDSQLFASAQLARFFPSAAITPDIDNFTMWGASFGYMLYGKWAYELTYTRGNSELEFIDSRVKGEQLRLDGYYLFNERRQMHPLIVIGGGKQRFAYQDNVFDNDMFNIGAGLITPADDNLRIRADLRAIYDFERDLTSYSLNVSWLFGFTH